MQSDALDHLSTPEKQKATVQFLKNVELVENLSIDDAYQQEVYGVQNPDRKRKRDGIIRPKKDALEKLRKITGGLSDSQMRLIQEDVLIESL